MSKVVTRWINGFKSVQLEMSKQKLNMYLAFMFLQASLIEGDIAQAVPLIVFGCAAFLACASSFLLPETLNRKLPDTVEEAHNFSRCVTEIY